MLSPLISRSPVASTSGRPDAFNAKTPSFSLHQRQNFAQRRAKGRRNNSTNALSSTEVGQQFDGLFGKWTLDEQDRKEVLSYRAGLTVATAALVLDSAIALLPEDNGVKTALREIQNAVAVLGAAGLGTSYTLIHIYVTPLKRFLQALFVLGTLGGLYLIATQDQPVTEYVASHREAVWLVGPLFASVTGLGIKEGLCYGTPAAAGILLVTPIMCLGHLSGWMPEAGTDFLLVTFNILALLFASGKYTQTLRGDIGDKSIFQVQALPKEERELKWAQLESQRPSQ